MSQGDFIVMAFGVVVLISNVVTSWAVLTGKAQKRDLGPQPFEVSMTEGSLTVGLHREFCKPLQRRVTDLEVEVRTIKKKMELDKGEIIAAGEDRANALHTRIDGIPAKIIAILKDTKGLIG